MSKRILLVGGGTGGHVFPLMAVANSLRKIDPATELIVFGDGPFMSSAAREAGLPYKKIMAGKLRRYFSFRTILSPFLLLLGFIQCLWLLLRYMPDAIFTKGGYVSVMPTLVARLYFIPVYTHESDSVPGLANKIIGKISRVVYVSFESAIKYFNPAKVSLVGNPIRTELLQGNKESALAHFNLRSDKKTILIAGGSQGAKRINDAVLESLVQLVNTTGGFQVIHQCGETQLPEVKKVVDQYMKEGEQSYAPAISANYRLYPFFNAAELAMAYAAADVIVSRAGASNLFEIAALGKPAVVIPITNSASNHQMENGAEFEKYGAVVIEEANITPSIIINQIEDLLRPERYAEVSNKIKTFAKMDASDKIAQGILSV